MTSMDERDRPPGAQPEQGEGATRAEFLRGALGAGAAIGAGGLLAACGGGGSSGTSSGAGTAASTAAPSAGRLSQGGTMRIGLATGSAADSLSPWVSFSNGDAARQFAMYDSLTQIRGSKDKLEPTNMLVEELTPNKDGSVWTIRLKDGVEFHNGKTLDVDDFIYTTQQIVNPKTGAFNIGRFILFDIKHAKKLDKLTLRLPLVTPVAIMPDLLGDGSVANIAPVGFDIKKPVGTGPFKLKSFTPGRETVFERFPNYWGEQAKVDELHLVALPDETARYNALLSGQIDVLDSVPFAQLNALKQNKDFVVSSVPSGNFFPVAMRVDLPPFTDVKVRQAMRLAVDRKQVINTAFLGQASQGNDLFGFSDPVIDSSLVRNQDLEQAKSLLKQAGKEGVSVTLTAAPVGAGAIESVQVIAQNAKAAGFNVNLRQVDAGTYFGPNYLKWPFSIDTWPGLTYLVLITTNDGPNSHVNLTHFDNPQFNKLFKQAIAELDPNKRAEIAHELQKIEFNEGGNIIPAFPNYTAAYSKKVGGFYPSNLTGGAVAAGFYNMLGFLA
jgi:peptide/nickel transport system substrate-binding protein